MSYSSDGHSGLSNKKIKEINKGDFQTALSYLTVNENTTCFVIHVNSNAFHTGPYLQRTRLPSGERMNFLERLGFTYSQVCNILPEECYCKVFVVDRERRQLDIIENPSAGQAVFERYEMFASNIQDIYNALYELDRKLRDAGFDLPYSDLELSPIVVEAGERAYAQGQVFDFYADFRDITKSVKNEIFVIDAYASEDLFPLYLEKMQKGVKIHVLTNNPIGNFIQVARKFKTQYGSDFEVRQNPNCHDRIFFVDKSCWVIGQSIKDAATKKPTYLLKVNSYDIFRIIFEDLWTKGKNLV